MNKLDTIFFVDIGIMRIIFTACTIPQPLVRVNFTTGKVNAEYVVEQKSSAASPRRTTRRDFLKEACNSDAVALTFHRKHDDERK